MRSQIVTVSNRSQIATTSKRNIRHRPLAFTEHGALMAANILNSPRAVAISVYVIRAFVHQLSRNTHLHLISPPSIFRLRPGLRPELSIRAP